MRVPVFLILLLVLTLAGCGGSHHGTAPAAAAPTAPQTQDHQHPPQFRQPVNPPTGVG